MTTKVIVKSPDNSHWDLEVHTEDKVWGGWSRTVAPQIVAPGGESQPVYLHNHRRVVIEEKPKA